MFHVKRASCAAVLKRLPTVQPPWRHRTFVFPLLTSSYAHRLPSLDTPPTHRVRQQNFPTTANGVRSDVYLLIRDTPSPDDKRSLVHPALL